MKILYTLNSGSPGGMERHVLDLVHGLLAKNHEVHVWCKEGIVAEWFEKSGAKVTLVSINWDIDASYIFSLISYVKDHKIDLVHAHELKACGNAILASPFFGAKVVTHVHTPLSEWQVPKLKKFFTVKFYAFLQKVFKPTEIALTSYGRDVKVREGIPFKNIKVIPNAIDVQRFVLSLQKKEKFKEEILTKYGFPNDTVVFGMVSRLTIEKGVEVAIRAFSIFCKNSNKNPYRYKLLIAGGGNQERNLRDLINHLGIQQQVVITGVFPDSDLLKYYATFDFFLFPSLAEGFGLVMLEALASGIPVVCSNLPVLQEVGGNLVSTFEVGNSQDLADKMITMVENPLKIDISNIAEKFGIQSFFNSYEALYRDLLKEIRR